MTDIRLEVTADGSHTLVNTALAESYHAFNGALTESLYVYIDSGLCALAEHTQEVRILEVGFGTGLNVLLTLQKARELGLRVHYTSLEPYPVAEALLAHLNYPAQLASLYPAAPLADDFAAIHQAPWDAPVKLNGDFVLHKRAQGLESLPLDAAAANLIYFDGFAPSKQPELWGADNCRKCFALLDAPGLLVTYCANGQFKRDLRAAGFRVQPHPGALGRREMTRAWKD
ncbi:tRNA (5-methylaminomethyl-2-thiouridine)(34)-methyltransferase MnmD [Shewanella cyperi]|uniref:tRNA (5-methylaminomethyl-2-thiouridine)(34)-methyltransferase MnmD n=1 Tax=Shewanella cyperi TaxID=2814292 RepID=A0A975AKN6_9GAMM|nr:tRNA (5-methylaminomethyl-2-thiouridine)(34)-methyltransferase MnmD [Shewanella cyperi]QSX29552.1 tRNA (5-methylaminomethyl-2-thiouridine)(34)-methyltransferase MnmD [Shewanella cyperi]